MIQSFSGPYSFDKYTVTNWNSTQIGVYYCGFLTAQGTLVCHYVGQAVGEGGLRGRLLQHLSENKWPDVSHFGYAVCATAAEAVNLEAQEIIRLKPKYNIQGKRL
jgi:excinuclease UvrABC nuclease subunit